jgi:ureidoacrylate peracid hydrolase
LPSEVPPARDIVPNINRLAAGMREAGGTVVWVQNTFDENIFQDWSAFLGKITNQELARGIAENLYEGSEGHALWPELETKEGDIWTKKNRYSAFLPEACDLAETLRDRDIDTVVITGTLTNVCCESSVRDAFMRNFSVVIVADGNATYTDAIHNASMTSMAMTFGDVMTTDEVLGKLEPVRVAAE